MSTAPQKSNGIVKYIVSAVTLAFMFGGLVVCLTNTRFKAEANEDAINEMVPRLYTNSICIATLTTRLDNVEKILNKIYDEVKTR